MLTIRPAVPADASPLATLLAQLGYEAGAANIPARLDALRNDGGVALVAVTEDGRVVGAASAAKHATLHADHPTGYITALVTDETVRRQGVGRQLVAALEQWARDAGCHRLAVTSAERRADAHAFYPSCGFPYTGRRFTKTLLDPRS
jgi:GNAT superfamily N-acetyltransferase